MEYNKPRGKMKSRWSVKYKKSINCNNPKGFSQKNYCKRQKRGGKYMKTFYEWLMIEQKDFLLFEDSSKKLYREVVKKLRDAGFEFVRTANDAHDVWIKDGSIVNVIRNIRSNPKIIFNQAIREWKKQVIKDRELRDKTEKPSKVLS